MRITNRYGLVACIFTALLITLIPSVSAESDTSNVTVYFFWGDGCPHCAKEKPFLKDLDKQYPGLEVRMFETWNNPKNAELLKEVAQIYDTNARGVPTTFIGDKHWSGYTEDYGQEIDEYVQECIETGCRDRVEESGVLGNTDTEETNEEEAQNEAAQETHENATQQEDLQNTSERSNVLCVHLFIRNNCSQCKNITGFIKGVEQEHEVEIKIYNVSTDKDRAIYQEFKETYGLTSGAFPIVFIGDKYFTGVSSIRNNIENEIVYCNENSCPCPLEKIEGMTPYLPQSEDITSEKQELVSIPLFGKVNLAGLPIAVTTAIISFIDGFNPCSLWLITFLLGIVIYSNSRKKILTVGGTFLLVTGAAYALFMAGLLNVFLYVGYLQWIQIGVAIIAFLFAVVNIKDYFWYKKGISFTIPDKYKPKIFKGMRDVMKTDKSFTATIVGTALLALGVVLVELPCTAGFPLVWTNMMAQNQIQGFAFLMLLLLYMVIYLSIEIVIILAALITMKATRFEEKHGRILKLIGGMIMLALALVMLINPNLMNNISTTVLVFGSAIAASFVVIFVHTVSSSGK